MLNKNINFNNQFHDRPISCFPENPIEIIYQKKNKINRFEKTACNNNNLKVGLSPSKIICFICFNETSLKMMKNGFYLILEAVFATFEFCPDVLVIYRKRLDYKYKVDFKLYDTTACLT